MTQKEAGNLVGLAMANYPGMQEKDMVPTAKLWQKMLSDIPYELAEKAILKVITTAKYFPTIAEIREAAVTLSSPNIPCAIEAWGEVMNALRRYGYYRTQEALDSLSPLTRQVVKMIGWTHIAMSEEIGVLHGQFRMAYEQYAKRARDSQTLPVFLQNNAKAIGESSCLL